MTETLLSELTTLGVGGPAADFLEATTEEELLAAVTGADDAGTPLLVLGGGSNVVAGDAGFDGLVVHVATRGLETDEPAADGTVLLRAAAGEDWDGVVARSLELGLSGLEPLSGIPGTAGATPVQNVGAYGTEVSQLLDHAEVWDRQERRRLVLTGEDLDFSYRDSAIKRAPMGASPRYVVLSVAFRLVRDAESRPLRYSELARRLDREVGQTAPAAAVRETVLALRAGKGMVLDPADRDTYSTGSFFTNPIIPVEDAGTVPADAPQFPVLDAAGAPDPTRTKLSAAWLIQHSGFDKGYGLEGASREVAGGRASLSTKHTLAITNRGEATAADVVAIARTVRDGVERAYGVRLEAEPVVVGTSI